MQLSFMLTMFNDSDSFVTQLSGIQTH